jgi:23S rRNA (adenine2503-C2)-methyltransferase
MLEYLLLAGVNDSLDDAGEVADWSRGLNVHLNLIPFNPVDGIGAYQSSSRERREAFAHELKQAGFKTTIRYSLGKDIAAACGQLARQENRAGR